MRVSPLGATLTSAAIGVALTPFMAAIWVYDPPGTDWDDTPWVTRTFGPWLESRGALDFSPFGLDPYGVYSKGFFLVYLLLLPVALAMHRWYVAVNGSSVWERWVWRAMVLGLVVGGVGDFVSYWGVSVPEVGDALVNMGFLVEGVSAVFLLIPATTAYAIVWAVQKRLPRWPGLLLLAWLPLSWFTLSHVADYLPNGVIVPLSLLWAAIAIRIPRQRA